MPLKKILVVPDAHVPYHDKKAFRLLLKAARKLKPDVLVIIGDFADFYSVSSHTRDPSRKALLLDEVNEVNKALDELDKLKVRRKIYVEGNHENRLDRYIKTRAPDLFEVANVQALFQLKRRGWEFVPYMEHIRVGKMYFTHDCGRSGKHANSQSLADFGHNITFGHSHRGSTVYGGTVAGDTHVGLNVGWLGDSASIDYLHKAKVQRDWQLGFGIVYLEPSGHCHAQFIPIIRNRCLIEGHLVTL